MQLTVRDVSRCLNVSESTVTRWVRQRGLPAQYVTGQHRFNRFALHDGKFRETLLRQAPREELLLEVCRVESSLTGPDGGMKKVAA